MPTQRYSAFSLLVSICLVNSFLSSPFAVAQDWTTSKEECIKKVGAINTTNKFLAFTEDLDKHDQKENAPLINKCLHSVNGLEDIEFLKDIVQQMKTASSICDADFINQFLVLGQQLRSNGTPIKLAKLKRNNRLIPFFKLLAAQVIETCKDDILNSLFQAEQSNEVLVRSLKFLHERMNGVTDEETFPTPINKDLASEVDQLDKACILIDRSMPPVARLAFEVSMSEPRNSLDLQNSRRAMQWFTAFSHCRITMNLLSP